MSLEFAIEFSCAVRRRFSEQYLRELARLASINSRFIEMSLNRSALPSGNVVNFIDRSRDKLQQVEEVMPICHQCPANLGNPTMISGETIGCLGRINYPIDAYFEHFLANRFQLILDTLSIEDWPRALHVLLDRETPFDGEGTKHLRRVVTPRGVRFFALRTPIRLNRQGANITTDNIFDMLMGFTASDEGASGYTRELPLMALADYSELLEVVFNVDLSEDERNRLAAESLSARQYLRYFEAIKRADELQVRMLLD